MRRRSTRSPDTITTASCWTSCCPTGSGLQLLEELKRQRRQAGIIIISARDSLDDKIEGLELGADDYLPKPFHLAELSARIRASCAVTSAAVRRVSMPKRAAVS